MRRKAVISAYLMVIGIVVYLSWPLRLALLSDPISTVLLDRDGRLLSAQIATDGQWRFPQIDSLPQSYIDCVTSYEDQRYYYHPGIDPIAIGRAIRQNLKAGEIVSGASTITMQLARLSQRDPDRTIQQKLKEMLIALRLEWQYSKDEILRLYATHAPYGGNVVGLETAAWRYFNKDIHRLSWSEMATLAVLPNAPSLIRLDKNHDALLAKRNALLLRLQANGKITKSDLELYLAEPLTNRLYSLPSEAPHLLERAKRDQQRGYITTTIDGDVQRQVNRLLDHQYHQLSQNGIHNAAVLILDTRTQDIIAYAGNIPNTTEESAVDMIQAHRSTGSILKPMLYAAAIEGTAITPHSWIKDAPVYIDGFSPSNYHKEYDGVVAADEALSRSLNIPFVLLLQQYGVERFRKRLHDLGLHTISQSGDHYGLSLILGGAEVRLDQLTTAYAHMARQLLEYDALEGKYNSVKYPSAHYSVMEDVAPRPYELPQQSYTAGAIWHTLEAIQELARPDDHGEWRSFHSSRTIAWKTGTSYGHRDAWAVGVRPDYTIGVWVGNADGEGRDQIIGVSTAGDLLFDVLEILPLESGWFVRPYDDMAQLEICSHTGYLPTQHCVERDTIWASEYVLGTETCPYHHTVWMDAAEEYRADRSCAIDEPLHRVSRLVLPPLMAQYHSRLTHLPLSLPPLHPACHAAADAGPQMEMIYPIPAERIYIPRDLNEDRQSIIAQVAHADPESSIYWYVNGEYQGETAEYHTLAIDGRPGPYEIVCTDESGQQISRRFEIVGR